VNQGLAGSRVDQNLARLAGGSAFISGLSAVAVLIVQAFQGQDRSIAGALSNLLLVPTAVYFWWRLGPGLALNLSTACGIASLLLWATHLAIKPMGFLETAWIWLAALWWLGLGTALRPVHPRLGLFTLILALAAVLDAIVSSPGLELPFLLFALLGAWKIPLSFVWAFAVGLTLLRGAGRVRPD
jgi:hypothetical protein